MISVTQSPVAHIYFQLKKKTLKTLQLFLLCCWTAQKDGVKHIEKTRKRMQNQYFIKNIMSSEWKVLVFQVKLNFIKTKNNHNRFVNKINLNLGNNKIPTTEVWLYPAIQATKLKKLKLTKEESNLHRIEQAIKI